MRTVVSHVNGAGREVGIEDEAMPLLYALRDELGLRGPRFGCGLGQCGACMVLIDGVAVRSCQVAAGEVGGRIVTLEGLGSPEAPSPVQAAFIAAQAGQCGYCSNGMIIAVTALLQQVKRPGEAEVRAALAGNLCRCGAHDRIVKAAMAAAGGV
jgi:nicotinate dehydrogenase subunit A